MMNQESVQNKGSTLQCMSMLDIWTTASIESNYTDLFTSASGAWDSLSDYYLLKVQLHSKKPIHHPTFGTVKE